jgi:hypothetical protein
MQKRGTEGSHKVFSNVCQEIDNLKVKIAKE